MSEKQNDKLAVLIDADNAQASIIAELLEEISKFGIASIKRAYGDWTTTNLKNWKEHLHKHAIQPMQQFSYTTGKNSTDSSLIIDAMDILHENHLDGFCIVSSDSDFTRLATRIREAGLVVYGFGEEKTPESFTSACDKFIFTENLRKREDVKKTKADEKKLKNIMSKAINAVSTDDGWAILSGVASYISKNIPSFDPRSYGYDKYGKLIESLNYIEVDKRAFQDGSTNVHIYIKIKDT
ncbi:NYN domain-containing protein [Sulfurospirillum arcachonense]|uniref:NYN domain-containing protein n=1 Tax=Sulfurospirillum arcachonense TaxID=57666 RepID=UPI0004695DA6|nr:NYN domain-containing protein [Sulfurospirillum arcachonense]